MEILTHQRLRVGYNRINNPHKIQQYNEDMAILFEGIDANFIYIQNFVPANLNLTTGYFTGALGTLQNGTVTRECNRYKNDLNLKFYLGNSWSV
jgi:hypothetical protein